MSRRRTDLRSLRGIAGLGLCLGVVLVAAAAPGERSPTLVALVVDGPEGGVPVRVEVVDEAGRSLSIVDLEAPGVASLSPAPEPPWVVTATATGYWSEPREVTARSARVELRLVRATTLVGRLRVPPGSESPRVVKLRWKAAIGPAELTRDEHAMVCPVSEKGVVSCTLPALSGVDLALRAPGFATRSFRALDLSAGVPHDLGVMNLVPGGSLVGRLEVPPGFDLGEVRLHLVSSGSPLASDESASAIEQTVDPRGQFAFEALAEGTYRLRVTHPRLASIERSAIQVRRGGQTAFEEPIALVERTLLRLQVTPAFDPQGGDWRIRLLQDQGGGRWRPAEAGDDSALAGYYTAPVGAGSYEVTVLDSRGAELAMRRLEVAATEELHQIEVTAVAVRGEVRYGADPLVARISFRDSSAHVEMETDAGGEFAGFLPRTGEWDVEVEGWLPPVRRRIRALSVAVAAGSDAAYLELSFPASEIHGLVVDDEGRPRAGATVRVSDSLITGRTVTTTTDLTGEFSMYGLDSGVHQVQAVLPDPPSAEWSSALKELEVVPGRPTTLRLELTKNAVLAGRVVDSSGAPLANTWLEIEPVRRDGRIDLAYSGVETTSATGAFRVQVPAAVSAVNLTILAPGVGLAQRRLPPTDVGDVTVPRGGGSLVVELPSAVAWTDPTGVRPALVHANGQKLFLGLLAQWAVTNGFPFDPAGDRLEIPLVEPGSYRVCWVAPHEWELPFVAGQHCSGVEVVPGGVATAVMRPPPG